MASHYGYDTEGNYWVWDEGAPGAAYYGNNANDFNKAMMERGGLAANQLTTDEHNKLNLAQFTKMLGASLNEGNGNGSEDPNAWAKEQAAKAEAEKRAQGNMIRDIALGNIGAIEGERDFILGENEKNRAVEEALARKQQEQNERDFKVQSHINTSDWQSGENSAMKGSQDIAAGGIQQLSNLGVNSGSMRSDLMNQAIQEFGANQGKVNQEFGKSQSQADRNINLQRKATDLAIAQAWDKMMAANNQARAQYADALRTQYGQAAQGEQQAGGNYQQWIDKARSVDYGQTYDRRAPSIDTTYTAKPISSFYKNLKMGQSAESRDERLEGPSQAVMQKNNQYQTQNQQPQAAPNSSGGTQ